MEGHIELSKAEITSLIEGAISKYIRQAPQREYISVKEFAEIFAVKVQTVHLLIIQKKIEAMQAYGTRKWIIPFSEIEKYKIKSLKKTKKDIFERSF